MTHRSISRCPRFDLSNRICDTLRDRKSIYRFIGQKSIYSKSTIHPKRSGYDGGHGETVIGSLQDRRQLNRSSAANPSTLRSASAAVLSSGAGPSRRCTTASQSRDTVDKLSKPKSALVTRSAHAQSSASRSARASRFTLSTADWPLIVEFQYPDGRYAVGDSQTSQVHWDDVTNTWIAHAVSERRRNAPL